MVGIRNTEFDLTDTFSVSPTFINSKITDGELCFIYNVNIFSPSLNTPKKIKVNSSEIKEKLLDVVKPTDKKYIKVKYYDDKKCMYSFDVNTWFDSVISKKVDNYLDEKKYIAFKKKLPDMVKETTNDEVISNFINKRFIKYIEKNSSVKRMILGKNKINDYNFTYDINLNKIIAEPKKELKSAVLINAKKDKKVEKIDFDKSVYSMLKCK